MGSTLLPEFRPRAPLIESLAESIAWMDKNGLVPDSDSDDLEDRIIAAVRELPNHLSRNR